MLFVSLWFSLKRQSETELELPRSERIPIPLLRRYKPAPLLLGQVEIALRVRWKDPVYIADIKSVE